MTLPLTSAALLRALRDAGGSMAYRDALMVTPGAALAVTSLADEALAIRVKDRSGATVHVELTRAGRIEAARLATEKSTDG